MTFDNKIEISLAPMAGVADFVFRDICSSFGEIRVFTEMVSAKALYYDDKKTKELFPDEREGKIPVQIFGHEPKICRVAAKKAEPYASEININMGCPMPKIFNNGDGSALMGNGEVAKDIVRAVKESVSLPVTVKIRKGIKEDTAVEFALMMEEAGADKIYVHGRTREEMYSGKADRDVIKRVKEALKIPVIGNGDIFSLDDALSMLSSTGCDGIMVGRGALGNPFIFRELLSYFENGEKLPVATKEERVNMAILHLEKAVSEKGERGLLESRKHLAWYLKSIPGAAKVRAKIFSSYDIKEVKELMKALLK